MNTLTVSYSQKESLPSQSSLAEPWLPTGMFRELNTPAPDPDVDTSFSVPDLNAESPVPNLEAHSPNLKAPTVYEEVVETTIKKTTATKFKFKKLEKKVENSGECDKPKQDDAPQESPVEDLRAPKIQTEYIGRPVVTVVIIVTFPLDFVSITKTF